MQCRSRRRLRTVRRVGRVVRRASHGAEYAPWCVRARVVAGARDRPRAGSAQPARAACGTADAGRDSAGASRGDTSTNAATRR